MKITLKFTNNTKETQRWEVFRDCKNTLAYWLDDFGFEVKDTTLNDDFTVTITVLKQVPRNVLDSMLYDLCFLKLVSIS